jgi:hypothetical protein
MDACSADPMTRPRAPKEDDMSLCVHCAFPYTRHGDRWVPTTNEEWNALDPKYQRRVMELALACRLGALVRPPGPEKAGRA